MALVESNEINTRYVCCIRHQDDHLRTALLQQHSNQATPDHSHSDKYSISDLNMQLYAAGAQQQQRKVHSITVVIVYIQ